MTTDDPSDRKSYPEGRGSLAPDMSLLSVDDDDSLEFNYSIAPLNLLNTPPLHSDVTPMELSTRL